MRIVYFSHSVVSCWNHGNAHFQRGILRALSSLGHDAVAYEPANGWSLTNLVRDQGTSPITEFTYQFPALQARTYDGTNQLDAAIDGADIVIVHEWNDPAVIAALGQLRRNGRFILLFHDTHHRAVSDPGQFRMLDLSHYDAVLAFGDALAEVYRRWGWGRQVFVWHEAADTALFHPLPEIARGRSCVWIGNWGDNERSAELENMLICPARQAGVRLDIYGVRYPPEATAMLAHYGARYHGWLPNASVPTAFARHRFTVHVPRRFYTQALPGIPTIRVFEALSCGIPLIISAWSDSEELFRPGEDYLVAGNGVEMERLMREVMLDDDLADHLATSGLERIRTRHSCDIRAKELLSIIADLHSTQMAAQ